MGFPFLFPSGLCYNIITVKNKNVLYADQKGEKAVIKRCLCIALSVLILTAGACGKTPSGEESEPPERPAENPETEAPPAETEYVPPERDYDGRTFTFITGEDIIGYISREEVNGDVVNDSMFHTEASVEELYNTKSTHMRPEIPAALWNPISSRKY